MSAPRTAAYVSIRDDSGLRSLSRNERAFTRECVLRDRTKRRPLRVDGRTLEQVRPARLHLGRWDHGAECTVQWGHNTRVTSLCTAELVRPNLDRPNEGALLISVDLSPSASPSFRLAPPVSTGGMGVGGGTHQPNYASQGQRLLSNRILRCIEKIIVTGGTLDLEALCLVPSQWVWRLQLALTVLDDGGNLMDACVMAAIASLRHYRKPHVDLGGGTSSQEGSSESSSLTTGPILIPSHLKEPTPLPLHHTPLAISFAFIPMEDGSSLSTSSNTTSSSSSTPTSSPSLSTVAALLDPTDREELLQNGSLTVGMNTHAEVCLLDYGGGCELPPTQLKDCLKKAESCIRQLCTMLEVSLEEADQQAQKDRLAKLQQQQWSESATTMATPMDLDDNDDSEDKVPPNTTSPYFQQSETPGEGVVVDGVNSKETLEQSKQMEEEAEEAYKRKALDFTEGHQAMKVREDNDIMKDSSKAFFNRKGSFLNKLFQSAKQQPQEKGTLDTVDGHEAKFKADVDMKDAQKEPLTTGETTTPVTEKSKAAEPSTKTRTSKAPAAITKEAPPPKGGQLDSDEEETTHLLQSEFDTPAPAPEPSKPKVKKTAMEEDDGGDDEIDDLAMAITKRKKKKKKDKKK